jgi:AraC-like DNA-binding protein
VKNDIKKYLVQHPILRKYIKFFWELRIEKAQFNHKIIPQRNINLRFNLSDSPHFLTVDRETKRLEDTYFLGLHNQNKNLNLQVNGKIDVLGVCFYPYGFYPFIKAPISEFRNQLVGAKEVSFKSADIICEKLKEASNIITRLNILEDELLLLLSDKHLISENFHHLFEEFRMMDSSITLTQFCNKNNINPRKLERDFNKYIGISANTYNTLNRFHTSTNQILSNSYQKISDLAYDNGYFDQMHFIKDFKRFAGNTPKKFIQQNNSILQIGKIV